MSERENKDRSQAFGCGRKERKEEEVGAISVNHFDGINAKSDAALEA